VASGIEEVGSTECAAAIRGSDFAAGSVVLRSMLQAEAATELSENSFGKVTNLNEMIDTRRTSQWNCDAAEDKLLKL
jgi:hypothetical protein